MPVCLSKCPLRLSKIESKHQASKSLKIGNCKPGKRRSNVAAKKDLGYGTNFNPREHEMDYMLGQHTFCKHTSLKKTIKLYDALAA